MFEHRLIPTLRGLGGHMYFKSHLQKGNFKIGGSFIKKIMGYFSFFRNIELDYFFNISTSKMLKHFLQFVFLCVEINMNILQKFPTSFILQK